jgi:hypothetical protein
MPASAVQQGKRRQGVIKLKKEVTKILALLLTVVFATGLSACAMKSKTGTPDAGQNNTKSEHSGSGSSTITKKEFNVIQDESDLPEEALDAIDALKDKKGFTWFKTGDKYIVVVFSGEKNTGGYGISVTEVSEIDGKTMRITVEETSPGKDDMVIMVITYPWVAISIESKTEDFLVRNKDGEIFEKLEYDSDSGDSDPDNSEPENTPAEITVKAKYVGEIDGSSIAATIDGEEIAFRHEKVQKFVDVVNTLKPGDIITLVYYTNEYGQNIIVKIEPSNSN